jgi:hypothetical protein
MKDLTKFIAHSAWSKTIAVLSLFILLSGIFLAAKLAQVKQTYQQQAESICVAAGGMCIPSNYSCPDGYSKDLNDTSCKEKQSCCYPEPIPQNQQKNTNSQGTTKTTFGDIMSAPDQNSIGLFAILQDCWKKSVSAYPICAQVDRETDGIIDQLDYNILIKEQ